METLMNRLAALVEPDPPDPFYFTPPFGMVITDGFYWVDLADQNPPLGLDLHLWLSKEPE